MCSLQFRVVEARKKRLLKRRLVQAPFKAPIHSKCCIGGFRETGLALVIVLRCDWPLCDIWFKSYEHFKIKMFLSVHTAGPWWIFQPKSSAHFPPCCRGEASKFEINALLDQKQPKPITLRPSAWNKKNGDPKTEKGPHGDPVLQMRTHLVAVE